MKVMKVEYESNESRKNIKRLVGVREYPSFPPSSSTRLFHISLPLIRLSSDTIPRQHRPTTMPICIECRKPVAALYTTYSKADDKALGKGVRLTQCPRCKRFADKYVEHDFVVLFIDLVLIKPQVCMTLIVFPPVSSLWDGFFLAVHSITVAELKTFGRFIDISCSTDSVGKMASSM